LLDRNAMSWSFPSPLAIAVALVLAACGGVVAPGPGSGSSSGTPPGSGASSGSVAGSGGAPGSSGVSGGSGSSPPHQDGGEDGGVISPSSGLEVQAAISSATLGDEGCASASGSSASAGACVAPASDAAMRTGPCDSACRPSTIQIQFIAGAGKTSARVEVADVRLLDAAGATLERLSASDPQSWDAATGSYKPWDQTVLPSSALKASFTLSSPSWSTFGQSYSATYRLEITLLIDGTPLVLQSGPLNREPLVST
jgi:hypothetical protein